MDVIINIHNNWKQSCNNNIILMMQQIKEKFKDFYDISNDVYQS